MSLTNNISSSSHPLSNINNSDYYYDYLNNELLVANDEQEEEKDISSIINHHNSLIINNNFEEWNFDFEMNEFDSDTNCFKVSLIYNKTKFCCFIN